MDQNLASAWSPPEGVTRHAGGAIPAEFDFFVAPPPEIGRIISADTSLSITQQPIPFLKRLIKSVLSGVLGTVITGLILLFFKFPVILILIFGGMGGGIFALVAYIDSEFKHFFTYVGEVGIAEVTLKGSRQAKPKTRILCFKEAGNLFTSQTRRYKSGVYRGTSYTYQWTRPGHKNFVLSGQHGSETGWPDDKSHWHFANAAEGAWSHFLLNALNEQLISRGYVEFPILGNLQAVRIGQGFLEFVLKTGETQRVAVSDMRDIGLGGGEFRFVHQDARWWSGKGKYSFSYNGIPNARLFLMCLKTLVGISF
ncbi:hypothetical protein H6G20_24310 [Desertifilum sp. FACHB-1129]|uniref:Uncharacterized protein n=1 Tax=Desertifilum tharense IPPAS B-1220 TaxID=1781255 RepID=A0A1E5QG12_9CYAN|nr:MULTISPECIES: hypothetical protein [Desertifilum]MDA0210628.1 hypothetical protein [Cyanobacteria bacterium FC1]MBD2314797.1 hypothetical protein [Desertifilum sp. FACHB-1129]MBD2323204.1 hypothetical protein [Desertifilum sp. FACHB-866]MBD2333049.1 hypothetical protein [Desertifilum sp. FACHB-868]OEJ73625.1 hypothetical protein BH720_18675 [Desertifilum tharense IPPAS B-1220]